MLRACAVLCDTAQDRAHYIIKQYNMTKLFYFNGDAIAVVKGRRIYKNSGKCERCSENIGQRVCFSHAIVKKPLTVPVREILFCEPCVN